MTTSAVNDATTVGVPEHMCVALMRCLPETGVVSLGVGSIMPMVAIFAAKHLGKDITVVTIANSVEPSPEQLPYSTMSRTLIRGSAAILPNEAQYDLIARGCVDTMFLGGGQIGRDGSINSSAIGDYSMPSTRLPGGGGAAFILPLVRNVVVWRTKHTRRIFTEQVDFVTSKGNLRNVVTPRCVFGMTPTGLQVQSVLPPSTLDDVAAETGFQVDTTTDPPSWAPPTSDELDAVGHVDPERLRAAGVDEPQATIR